MAAPVVPYVHARCTTLCDAPTSLVCHEVLPADLLEQLRNFPVENDPNAANYMDKVRSYIRHYGRHQGIFQYEQVDFTGFAPAEYQGSVAVGRLYPRNRHGQFVVSSQQLPAKLRNSLFRHTHVEVDIRSSLPTMLYHLFRHPPLQALPDLVKDYDGLLERFPNATSAQLKRVVLCTLKGKGQTWGLAESPGLEEFRRSVWVARLRADWLAILVDFRARYAPFIQMVRNKKNGVGNFENAALAFLCQDLENQVLGVMLDYLRARHEVVSDVVPLFDGALLSKEYVDDDTVRGMEEEVFDRLRLQVSIRLKPMEPFFPFLRPAAGGEPEVEEEDTTEYLEGKQQFERSHYFLELTNACVKTVAGECCRYKPDYFRTSVCLTEPKDFVKQWLADPHKRSYIKEDFLPPPLTCEADVLNCYTGLKAESLEPVEPAEVLPLISRVLAQVCVLTGSNAFEEPPAAYLLNWLACKVQQPGMRARVCLGFRSKEGTGKDTFFEWFGVNVLGSQYFRNFANLKMMFRSSQFPMVEDRLLVSVSEVCRGDHREIMHQLKSFLTDPAVTIRRLYQEGYSKQNLCSVVLFSQDDQFLDLDTVGDRRYQVFNCSPLKANDADYFTLLFESYNDARVARAFFQFLKERDVSDWNASRDRVQTSIQRNMARYSCHPIISFLVVFLPMEQLRVGPARPYVDVTNAELRSQFGKFLEERYTMKFFELSRLSHFKAKLSSLEMDCVFENEQGERDRAMIRMRKHGNNIVRFKVPQMMKLLRAMFPEDDAQDDEEE